MTYVEFFDKTACENICSCLTHLPERVIFIGTNSKHITKAISKYSRVFKDRGHEIEFKVKTVTKSNFDNAVKLLSEIVNTYDDCVFDITGGEEILVLALGKVCEMYPEKNIQIHTFNVNTNAIYDCDMDGNTIYKEIPVLSVEENIRIYGGDIAYGNDKTVKWDMNADFEKDIDLIWDICKNAERFWNVQIDVFEMIKEKGKTSEDGLTDTIKRTALENHLEQQKKKYTASGIIKALLKIGVLTCFDDSGDYVSVSYKNEQVRHCLTKAGQALEMKIFKTVKNLRLKDGTPVYNDIMNGVYIDWDGEFHDEKVENEFDTENEIDIMLMHNTVPIFISCKNGNVTAEELYKLNTVANRFGDKYAKKVLVATSISRRSEKDKYLRARIEDMGIRLIEIKKTTDDKEFASKLNNLWF